MDILFDLLVIGLSSIIIFFAGNKFAAASSKIGNYFNMPNSVKGATLDAISSSMPELMVALFSVIIFNSFEIGVGTIVGSALFNLLFIPALCVLISKRKFTLGKEVVNRDGVFYAISVLFLLLALLYSKSWGVGVAIFLLSGYFVYIFYIIKHTGKYRAENKKAKNDDINIQKQMLIAFAGLILIGISTYFLTRHSESISINMDIPPVIIGFTIVAIATSLPDGIISIADTKSGTNDDAISNMLGSNIFNIFVALSIPLFIAAVKFGPVMINFNNIEVVISLLIVTLGIVFALHKKRVISKTRAVVFLLIFFAFQGYFLYLAFI